MSNVSSKIGHNFGNKVSSKLMAERVSTLSFFSLLFLALLILSLLAPASLNAQTAPPPAFGEATKGKPAISETEPLPEASEQATTKAKATEPTADDSDGSSLADNLLGEATIKESRRENGQVYLIELEHSSGSKQYIEEHDSDGELSSDGKDLEDTVNLPKWKLGSW